MAYKFGYQAHFTNVEETNVYINIYDTKSGAGTTTFTQVTAAEDPLHLMVVDTDEDKFSSIRAKEAEIAFVSTAEVNLNSFIGSEDNRWLVEVFFETDVKFRGFLLTDEISEDFLDSDTSNVVQLVATDNIGLLKDITLTKSDGANPRGYFNHVTYLAWCLQKTGLSLPINIVHNVHEEHTPGKIMFESTTLQSKTFEEDFNVSEDCYTVIEKLLNPYCYLTQADGEWWVISVDELQNNATVVKKFNSDGVYLSEGVFNTVQTIAPDSALEFSGMSTFVKVQAAVREATLTYSYQYPKEIIDNIDFSRGSIFQYTRTDKLYRLDDWVLKYNNFGTQLNPSPDGQAFIYRRFEDDYEKERYAVIQQPGGNNLPLFLSAAKVPVHALDKFDISVDSRYKDNINGGGIYRHATIHVMLRAENGNVWTLHDGTAADPNSVWQVGSSFAYIYTELNLDAEKLNEWKTTRKRNPYPPIPADGELEISLVFNTSFGKEKYFSNLSFTYTPYINGSYAKYSGQHNRVSQNIGTKKVVDEGVYVSDSPKKLFKGAIHYYNGTRYVLAGKFYDGRLYPSAVPTDATQKKPYGAMQAFSVWNQNNRPFRLFDFQAQGISTEPDIIHKYVIADSSAHTNDKYFMLLHYDMDVKLCEVTGVMAEVWDNVRGKDYSSAFEFKYISD